MSDKRKGTAGKGELGLVLLVAALTEAVSIGNFQPELREEMIILLSMVSAGSLLVIGAAWMHLSSLPPRIEARTVRQPSPRGRRGARVTMPSKLLSGWIHFKGGRRAATVIVLLLLFGSLSLVILATSQAALTAYRLVYASTPDYIHPYLRSTYAIVKPLMKVNPVEKCLLVQNVPAIFIAAISLIIFRRAK